MLELKILDSKFIKINGYRNPNFSGDIKTKTNLKIIDIKNIKNTNLLRIKYDFEIVFGNLGQISISGMLIISTDPETSLQIQNIWKDKKIETPQYITIANIIIQKASLRAIQLEEELSLPIHIKLPKLSVLK
ncbi:MAG: hypothetical protein Q8N88_05265 [Nanoarchaeota archaeon]|nr:hypothetical protein [Nanoarchaeota archaeon]